MFFYYRRILYRNSYRHSPAALADILSAAAISILAVGGIMATAPDFLLVSLYMPVNRCFSVHVRTLRAYLPIDKT